MSNFNVSSFNEKNPLRSKYEVELEFLISNAKLRSTTEYYAKIKKIQTSKVCIIKGKSAVWPYHRPHTALQGMAGMRGLAEKTCS